MGRVCEKRISVVKARDVLPVTTLYLELGVQRQTGGSPSTEGEPLFYRDYGHSDTAAPRDARPALQPRHKDERDGKEAVFRHLAS